MYLVVHRFGIYILRKKYVMKNMYHKLCLKYITMQFREIIQFRFYSKDVPSQLVIRVFFIWSLTPWPLGDTPVGFRNVIVRRAGLLWSQQDFEWRRSVPLFKCLTVLEFSFILFDLCLLITFFIFIMNYVPIVTFWIFTYHKIWILSIMFCSIWSYWIIYFLACLEVSWRVVS